MAGAPGKDRVRLPARHRPTRRGIGPVAGQAAGASFRQCFMSLFLLNRISAAYVFSVLSRYPPGFRGGVHR